jgi:hypothetical protein
VPYTQQAADRTARLFDAIVERPRTRDIGNHPIFYSDRIIRERTKSAASTLMTVASASGQKTRSVVGHGVRWRAVGWPPITDELASAQQRAIRARCCRRGKASLAFVVRPVQLRIAADVTGLWGAR